MAEKKTTSESPYQVEIARNFLAAEGKPKSTELNFGVLRSLRNMNPLVNVCIETLKHMIVKMRWNVVTRDEEDVDDFKDQIDELTLLFLRPNPQDTYRTFWLKLIEDVLVIDRGVTERIYDSTGSLAELWPVDGATIRPKFDKFGVLMDPAYVQVVDNKVIARFEEDEIDVMMNSPVNTIGVFGYGKSPVERIGLTIMNYIQADQFNAQVFDKNTLPPYLVNMPGFKKEQVTAFREAWEIGTAGDLWKGVFTNSPKDAKIQIEKLRESNIDMQFFEMTLWLARVIIAAFELSPQDVGLTMDVNKATAEVQRDLTKNQGIASLMGVIEEYYNTIIWDLAATNPRYANLEFKFEPLDMIDEKAQAEIDALYLDRGVLTPDEVRSRMGRDALEVEDETEDEVIEEEVIEEEVTEEEIEEEPKAIEKAVEIPEVESVVKAKRVNIEVKRAIRPTEIKMQFESLVKKLTASENILLREFARLAADRVRPIVDAITQAALERDLNQVSNMVAIPNAPVLFPTNQQINQVTSTTLRNLRQSTGFEGADREFLEKLNNANADTNVTDATSKINTKIRNLANSAVANNLSFAEIEDSVEFEMNKWLNTTVSVAISAMTIGAVTNAVKNFGDENDPIIAYEYSAILDDRTTEYCRSLDGKIFHKDDPILSSIIPPNHYNCRSTLIPITRDEAAGMGFTSGENIEGFNTFDQFENQNAFVCPPQGKHVHRHGETVVSKVDQCVLPVPIKITQDEAALRSLGVFRTAEDVAASDASVSGSSDRWNAMLELLGNPFRQAKGLNPLDERQIRDGKQALVNLAAQSSDPLASAIVSVIGFDGITPIQKSAFVNIGKRARDLVIGLIKQS